MSRTEPYVFTEPESWHLPLLVSVPHAGTEFPAGERSLYLHKYLERPEDTDWFVDQIYSFVPDLGAGLLVARYSRYVIDLNRDPTQKNLYNDGRVETGLFPNRTFAGDSIYQSEPTAEAKEQRLANYYEPYHQLIHATLKKIKAKFGFAVLIDGHSIRRLVPSIRSQPFPDLILGNQDGKTCDAKMFEAAARSLELGGRFHVSRNQPFKGGYITRSCGAPAEQIQALQLEMCQDLYMNETSLKIDGEKYSQLQAAIKSMVLEVMKAVKP